MLEQIAENKSGPFWGATIPKVSTQVIEGANELLLLKKNSELPEGENESSEQDEIG